MLRKYAFLSTSHNVVHESRTYLCSPTPTSRTDMSLLQDVLRHQTLDSIERRFDTPHPDSDNSDDELVGVVCPPVSYHVIPGQLIA